MADARNPASRNGREDSSADAVTWLLDVIDRTFGDMTEEDWEEAGFPPDAAVQLDHYIYGLPKRPPQPALR